MTHTLRRRSRRLTGAAVAVLVVAAAGTSALARASDGAGSATDDAAGPGAVTIRLDIEHSRFSPSRLTVRPHTDVRFVVVNHDPIGHELIIGDREVHVRHASGTEAEHPARPGEVSVAPGETASTTFSFHAPGVVRFACHLPGHLQFGMKGSVTVEE